MLLENFVENLTTHKTRLKEPLRVGYHEGSMEDPISL